MKKVGVVLLILILLSTAVSAFSLTGYFSSLFSPQQTTITGTQANPIKVYPGQSLNILVAFEDPNGIESAVAYFPFEGGEDKVDMILSAGDENKGTFSATWVVHDTANMKWYKTKVILTNSLGTETITYVDWQDPTQSHPLNQLEPGLSQNAGTTGYQFYTSSATHGSYALTGNATYNGNAETFGVKGYTYSTSNENVRVVNPAGVWGETKGDGRAYGVVGKTTSNTDYATGVLGYYDNPSHKGYAVYGYVDDSTAGAAAVYGEIPSNANHPVYAIYGKATSAGDYSGYFTGGDGVAVDGNIVHHAGSCQSVTGTTSGVGGDVSAIANCLSDQEVVGGGCAAASVGAPCCATIAQSRPYNTSAWYCQVIGGSGGGGTGTATPYAMCCG